MRRTLSALMPVLPVFLSYVLSYFFIGIYWSNHHHLLQVVHHVNGRVLWANLHLLFWLSLVPFTTRWMGESNFAAWPVAVYGIVLILAACAYSILVRVLIAYHGRESHLAMAIGGDFKGNISIVLYAAAIALAFVDSRLACAVYALVAAMWLVPDRRIERVIGKHEN